MSVRIECPVDGARLTAADGTVTSGGLAVLVRGSAPRRAPLFVNDEVLVADAEGRFEVVCTLPAGDGAVLAGPLTGCACVQSRIAVNVSLDG